MNQIDFEIRRLEHYLWLHEIRRPPEYSRQKMRWYDLHHERDNLMRNAEIPIRYLRRFASRQPLVDDIINHAAVDY